MAAYTISNTSTTVTFKVTGISPPKTVWFTVRYDDANNKSMVIHESRSATSATLTETFSVPQGHKYATNVDFGDGAYLGLKTFDTLPDRPSDWSWSGIIYSGAPLSNLTASVWNRFTARINEFREYKNQSSYSFTTARSGVTDIADCVPQAVAAIRGLNGHGTLPSSVTISASTWIQLANAMNAVS